MDINRNDRNVYFSCTRGSIIQDVNRGKNATTVRPGGTPRITRPRDESLRSSSFYQPRFSQTEIRFESSLHRLMYAATVGCQVRDTDALFMQHRKVNISTKRRRRHRVLRRGFVLISPGWITIPKELHYAGRRVE